MQPVCDCNVPRNPTWCIQSMNLNNISGFWRLLQKTAVATSPPVMRLIKNSSPGLATPSSSPEEPSSSHSHLELPKGNSDPANLILQPGEQAGHLSYGRAVSRMRTDFSLWSWWKAGNAAFAGGSEHLTASFCRYLRSQPAASSDAGALRKADLPKIPWRAPGAWLRWHLWALVLTRRQKEAESLLEIIQYLGWTMQ